jgi:hypothetical protein
VRVVTGRSERRIEEVADELRGFVASYESHNAAPSTRLSRFLVLATAALAAYDSADRSTGTEAQLRSLDSEAQGFRNAS